MTVHGMENTVQSMEPNNPPKIAGEMGAGCVPRQPAGCVPPTGTVLARARQECGDYAIRIGRDGTWYYKGSAIQRKPMVCLFASILKRGNDGAYWLETPVERGRIEVEDAPFVAVELFWRDCDCGGGVPQQCLTFRTNLDEMVTADARHPIRVQLCPKTREPRPYITVRPGLEARISRAVFYELVALAESEMLEGREVLGVWSEGTFFPIDEMPTLDLAAD